MIDFNFSNLSQPLLDPSEPLSFYGMGILSAVTNESLPDSVNWTKRSSARIQGALTGMTLLEGTELPFGIDSSLQLELHNVLAARLLMKLPQDLSQLSVLSPVTWNAEQNGDSMASASETAETQIFKLAPLDARFAEPLYFKLHIHLHTGEMGRA